MKNKKIYAARMGLAKIANADLPLPALSALAPLLDACDPVIAKCLQLEGEGDSYFEDETELPDAVIPMLPELRMSYLDFRALREIATIEGRNDNA